MTPSPGPRVPPDVDPATPAVPVRAPDEAPGWFQRPANVRHIVGGLYLACALLLGVDLLYTRHLHSAVEERFDGWGFYGVYGFVSCVLLVMVAKGLRQVVLRPEAAADE